MASTSGMWIIAQETGLPQAPSTAPGGNTAAQGATSTGAPGAPPSGQAPPANPMNTMMMPLILGMVVLMLLTSIMGGRKEKKRRLDMMSSLKRHDRVLLQGGMIGTVTDLRDDEIVVKVDDSTNTRIHFMKSSVQQVLKSASGDTPAAESSAA